MTAIPSSAAGTDARLTHDEGAPGYVTAYTLATSYEQYDDRAVPFIGDYTGVTSMGEFAYGTWTDLRNTVAGVDPREADDDDADAADVKQCRDHTDEGGPETSARTTAGSTRTSTATRRRRPSKTVGPRRTECPAPPAVPAGLRAPGRSSVGCRSHDVASSLVGP